MPALASRASMPAMVETIHRVAAGHEGVNHVRIAAAMLPMAMDDCENGSRLVLGPPALVVELDTIRSSKNPFTVLQCDGSCSFPFGSSPEPQHRSATPLAKSGPKNSTMTMPRPIASGSLPNILYSLKK